METTVLTSIAVKVCNFIVHRTCYIYKKTDYAVSFYIVLDQRIKKVGQI